MTVKLGINPIGWSNDDMRELGAHIPLEACLAEARAAGFDGVELGHKFPTDPEALAAVLGAHDLRLVSGWYSTNLLMRDATAEFAAIQQHADRLLALGCDVVILAETTNSIHGDRAVPLSASPTASPADMKTLGGRLTELAERLAERGLASAYHHHMGTVVESRAEIDALMAATGPALGLLLDTGHALFAGADPALLAADYQDRITHIHCKDVRAQEMALARDRDLSFLEAVLAGVFTVPGDGCVDYPSVLSVAARANYHGWLVVEAEQDPDKANPATHAALGHANLAALARAAGLL
jgi:myo-inosose-2 dehydratase